MDDEFLAAMKQRLQIEQASLQAELARLEGLTGSDEALSDHAGLGNHMADDATELFEQEKNISLKRHTATLLTMVQNALRRIEQGTYGLCEQCGSEIDRARLKALPYVTLCVECKARQEKA